MVASRAVVRRLIVASPSVCMRALSLLSGARTNQVVASAHSGLGGFVNSTKAVRSSALRTATERVNVTMPTELPRWSSGPMSRLRHRLFLRALCAVVATMAPLTV